MKIILIIIDSILFFVFIILFIDNIDIRPFGINIGLWGMPIVMGPILLVNIIGILASYKSAAVKNFIIIFNGCLGFLCVLIFFYDAFPLIFPPAIFGIGLRKYIKFFVIVWFFGMHAVIIEGSIYARINRTVTAGLIPIQFQRSNSRPYPTV